MDNQNFRIFHQVRGPEPNSVSIGFRPLTTTRRCGGSHGVPPERFIGVAVEVKGQDFEQLPFRSSRWTMCPGISLELKMVHMILAYLHAARLGVEAPRQCGGGGVAEHGGNIWADHAPYGPTRGRRRPRSPLLNCVLRHANLPLPAYYMYA
jgi:hypothetical protein